MTRTFLLATLLSFGGDAFGNEIETFSPSNQPDARTPNAVVAADAAWLRAEIDGNYRFLEWFLLDGYESIDENGSVLSKASLVAKRRLRGHSKEFATAVTQWRRQHPNHAQVRVYGDTAILTWVSDDTHKENPVYSCDIFTYRDQHWHAVYSQHSSAER